MRLAAIASLIALLAAGAYSFTFATLRGERGPREVVIVAKDMAFVVDPSAAGGTLAPRIVLERGERVRLVLKNQDAGMRHDLVVEGLEVRSAVTDHGEAAAVEFRAPATPGEWDYYCSFHSQLMRGRIVVR